MPRFVVVTGLPASGKSTLGAALSTAIGLPLIDKDAILEALFDEVGTGDAAHRRALSRAADGTLQARALQSRGAVLVSWWRHPRSSVDSGTSTHWLASLPADIVELHCRCRPELAHERFFARTRHAGHLDDAKDRTQELERFRQWAALGPLGLGTVVEVDTGQAPDMERLIHEIAQA